ncbi:hypothetical protein KO481_16925 [Nocardia sp. NEAU-G5]|uniref:Uncharacterized protein n=1 Tax=Nocardia albiluteola TaxID=2842303 RepID=A0ABS6B1Q1_9NOCA|nr:hypothetical protein [Nocardia albiluteola]MBU3063205.1 hypothetical protein [Nocardia albiluteola]
MAFTGTVPEYVDALYAHNETCEICCPGGGLPNPNTGPLCKDGRALRYGLSSARGREAGRTGALL